MRSLLYKFEERLSKTNSVLFCHFGVIIAFKCLGVRVVGDRRHLTLDFNSWNQISYNSNFDEILYITLQESYCFCHF